MSIKAFLDNRRSSDGSPVITFHNIKVRVSVPPDEMLKRMKKDMLPINIGVARAEADAEGLTYTEAQLEEKATIKFDKEIADLDYHNAPHHVIITLPDGKEHFIFGTSEDIQRRCDIEVGHIDFMVKVDSEKRKRDDDEEGPKRFVKRSKELDDAIGWALTCMENNAANADPEEHERFSKIIRSAYFGDD